MGVRAHCADAVALGVSILRIFLVHEKGFDDFLPFLHVRTAMAVACAVRQC